MNCIIFLFNILVLLIQIGYVKAEHSPHPSINHICFSEKHLFYLSKTGNHFGFISRQSGEIMSKYELQSHESIISIHKHSDTIILRKSRERAILFDIKSSHLQEINIKISFKHQQIIDVLKLQTKIFVLTDKDVRVYEESELNKADGLKNIISSGRKNQYFKKMLLDSSQRIEDMQLVFMKNESVCLRTFKKVRRGTDECYFKTPYEISSIDRVNGSILIQTQLANYVITSNLSSFYSFKGKVTQIAQQYILLQEFKTYDIQNQIFLDGLIVQGSTQQHLFWIHQQSQTQVGVFYNSQLVGYLTVKQKPIRSWVSLQSNNKYQMLIQFPNYPFQMYDIEIKDKQPITFLLKWQMNASSGLSAQQL